jgi:hypothetical protein
LFWQERKDKTQFRFGASNGERQEEMRMKNIFWLIGGFCAAAVGFLVWGPKRTQPVELLAHRLEEAWADHHTVV